MNYTVNQLAKLSGVTARMLRFYDTIGLLKPAFVAESGYRYYQEKELLVLQQILFFRELGFELKQIQAILKQSDFDRQAALRSHKEILKKKIEHLQTLMVTIDKTINHIQGKQPMNGKELFCGIQNYSPEFQKYYHDFVTIIREEAKKLHESLYAHIPAAQKKTLEQKNTQFWRNLITVFQKKLAVDHSDVQRVIKEYVTLAGYSGVSISQTQWLQTAETFRTMPEQLKKVVATWPETAAQHADAIKRFDDHPGLADFLANAMKFYAEKTKDMTEKEYDSPELQKFHQAIAREAKKLGENFYAHIPEAQKKDLEQKNTQFWRDLITLFRKGVKIDHSDVQLVIKKYVSISDHSDVTLTQKQWLQIAESFRKMPERLKKAIAILPETTPQHTDTIKRFDDNPGLADYLANALKLYAERNLS